MLWDLGVILVLVLFNGVFAAAEIAMVSARQSRLLHLADEGVEAARRVLELRSRPETLLATVQVGVTAISSLAAAFGGARLSTKLAAVIQPFLQDYAPFLAEESGQLALAMVVTGISFVSLVAGELVPKSLAMRNAEALSLVMATPLLAMERVGRPLVWLLTTTSNILLWPFGDRTSFSESRVNVEELRVLIEEAARTGAVDARSGDIAARALDFSALTAGEVAVPRNRMRTLDVRATTAEVSRVFCEEGFHRMPIVDASPDRVVGYVTATDVLSALGAGGVVVLSDMLRPPLFVPGGTTAPALLRMMQEQQHRMAIVVDEHGGVDGMVTLEDLFEELVGDLHGGQDGAVERIKPLGAHRWLVMANTPVRELERVSGLRVPSDVDASTVAGVVLALAGEIPEAGSSFTGHGAEWKVTARTQRRIKQVQVERLSPPPARTPSSSNLPVQTVPVTLP